MYPFKVVSFEYLRSLILFAKLSKPVLNLFLDSRKIWLSGVDQLFNESNCAGDSSDCARNVGGDADDAPNYFDLVPYGIVDLAKNAVNCVC
jgi:hypothetical protein